MEDYNEINKDKVNMVFKNIESKYNSYWDKALDRQQFNKFLTDTLKGTKEAEKCEIFKLIINRNFSKFIFEIVSQINNRFTEDRYKAELALYACKKLDRHDISPIYTANNVQFKDSKFRDQLIIDLVDSGKLELSPSIIKDCKIENDKTKFILYIMCVKKGMEQTVDNLLKLGIKDEELLSQFFSDILPKEQKTVDNLLKLDIQDPNRLVELYSNLLTETNVLNPNDFGKINTRVYSMRKNKPEAVKKAMNTLRKMFEENDKSPKTKKMNLNMDNSNNGNIPINQNINKDNIGGK